MSVTRSPCGKLVVPRRADHERSAVGRPQRQRGEVAEGSPQRRLASRGGLHVDDFQPLVGEGERVQQRRLDAALDEAGPGLLRQREHDG